MPRSNSLIFNINSRFWTCRWPLPSPTWPQPAKGSHQTDPKQSGPPLVVCTGKAVIYTFNICPGFGTDEISHLPRIYLREFICHDLADKIIVCVKSQQGPSIQRRPSLSKHLLSTYSAHVSGVGSEHGSGQRRGNYI